MAISNSPQIIIAGCGPGHPDYLTTAVKNAVTVAEVLVGAPHLLDLFTESKVPRIPVGRDIQKALTEMEAQRQRQIVVLVSGDTGLFSLARSVQKHFGAQHCRLIPGISSVQVACARLGLDWGDLRIVSAHGRRPGVTANELKVWQKIAVLAGTNQASQWVAEVLQQLGSRYCAFACENLTWEEEQIRQMTSDELGNAELASRTIILLIDQELAP